MKRICAWCKKNIGEIEPKGNKRVTHGICASCKATLKKEMGTKKEDTTSQEDVQDLSRVSQGSQ